MGKIAEWLCFWLAVSGKKIGIFQKKDWKEAQRSPEEYRIWRSKKGVSLKKAFASHFDLKDKVVLDFGCGIAGFGEYYVSEGAQQVIGADHDDLAIQYCKNLNLPKCQFIQCEDEKIPLEDDSVDLIITTDVFEHLLNPAAILSEWWRILRKNGQVLLDFAPFYSARGAHLKNLLPLPYIQVIFSEKTITKAAAKMYDSKFYTPCLSDYHPDGNKNPNKWRNLTKLPDLNKFKIADFEDLLQQFSTKSNAKCKFEVEMIKYQPISKLKGGLFKKLARQKYLREYLTSELFCVLKKIK